MKLINVVCAAATILALLVVLLRVFLRTSPARRMFYCPRARHRFGYTSNTSTHVISYCKDCDTPMGKGRRF